MKILHHISELSELKGPVALAIGVFDGVHLGHQEVIREARDYAEHHHGTCVVMTFDPHPLTVLRPDKAPKRLGTTLQITHAIESLNVQHLLVLKFTPEMAQTKAEDFVIALAMSCKPLGFISVGYDWAFGKGREGNVQRLMALGQQYDFAVCGVPAVKLNGEVISSTLVREAVRSGDFEHAQKMLGRSYSISGEVVRGRQLGKQIGFPTANIALQEVELPPNGVYAVKINSDERIFQGVANLGLKPTIDPSNAARSLEVHVFDFDADLYGKNLEVEFVKRIRDERKFPNLDTLKLQIAADVAAAREILQKHQ